MGSRAVWIGLEKHKGAVTHMEVSLTLLPSDSVPDSKGFFKGKHKVERPRGLVLTR